MHLIIGLGNPGMEYEGSRHNVGYMVVDRLAQEMKGEWRLEKKFKAYCCMVRDGEEDLLLVKPVTYMNLSGESVILLMNYYKVEKGDVVVIYDDIGLELGKVKVGVEGGDGGHNGLKDVLRRVGGGGVVRFRVGIGIEGKGLMGLSEYVLRKFSENEKSILTTQLEGIINDMLLLVREGVVKGMNFINRKGRTNG